MQTCFLVQATAFGFDGHPGIDIPGGVGVVKKQIDSVLQGTAMASVT